MGYATWGSAARRQTHWSGARFQGKKGRMSGGALPPEAAQVFKYSMSQLRGFLSEEPILEFPILRLGLFEFPPHRGNQRAEQDWPDTFFLLTLFLAHRSSATSRLSPSTVWRSKAICSSSSSCEHQADVSYAYVRTVPFITPRYTHPPRRTPDQPAPRRVRQMFACGLPSPEPVVTLGLAAGR